MLIRRTADFRVVLRGVFWAMVLVPTMTWAQVESPVTADTSTGIISLSEMPPNPNPTQRLIYPRKNQSEEQQLSDQLECYDWTCEQIDWDPYQAYAELVDAGYAMALTWKEMEQGLICLADQGAVTGAVAGEIVGDPETGAEIGAAIAIASGLIRSNYLNQPEDPAAKRAVSRFEHNLKKWDVKFAGCLSRKGYRVPSS